MEKHSKGPWRIGDAGNTIFGPPNGNVIPEIIAYIHKGNKENARLISSAPELLEAIYMLLGCADLNMESLDDSSIEAIKIARKAISKAEGKL